VERYSSTVQATDGSMVRHVNFVCCISKATEVHSEYVIMLFRGNSNHANAPQCYVIRTLPVSLFSLNSSDLFIKTLVCGLKKVFSFHQHPDLAAAVR